MSLTGTDTRCLDASPVQRRLWLAAAVDPSGAAYNMTFAVRLQGTLDETAMRRALAFLVARHDALRTVFERRGSRLVQVVHPIDVLVPIDAEDWSGSDDDLADLLGAESAMPFDLEGGLLLRARLLRITAADHVLCLTLHHLICDGWSVEILASELGAAYAACARHATPDLPVPPVQYPDVAEFSHQRHAHEQDAAVEYWTRALAGAPPSIDLPRDYLRPPAPTGAGDRISSDPAPGLTAAVRAFARQQRTTPAVVWLALFGAFLSRWSGAGDLLIGTPASGRDREELEGVVGPFVTTVIPRFTFDGSPTLMDAVTMARQQMLDAMAHQHLPLDRVLQRLGGARTGGAPLFQVMFAWQPESTLTIPGLSCTRLSVPYRTSKAELTLFVSEDAGRTRLTFEFSSDVFRRETVHHGLVAFEQLATSMLAQPRAPVERLSWMTPGTRQALIASGTGASRPYPRDRGLADLFREQALSQPGHVAIHDTAGTVTYGDLLTRATLLARQLRDVGVQPGDRVALLLKPDRTLVTAVCAVVVAGAVYVPLNPSDPPERIEMLVRDSGATALVHDELPGALRLELPFVSVRATPTDRNGEEAVASGCGDDPAAFMYTSGTTGGPKAVVVPHRAIARLALNQSYITIRSDDRMALAANPAFDASTFELWGALLNGATVVPVSVEGLLTPAEFDRTVRNQRLTVIFLTTAVFNRIAFRMPEAFAPLRVLLFGGERSSPEAAGRVRSACNALDLVHVYGPTECTTFTTSHRVTSVDHRLATVPIGRPIANTSAFVLDDRAELVPPGVVGELHVGGDALALGYHGAPDLSAERFTVHPRTQQRLYRTGDRCRVTADGEIEFVERTDRQLKVRGFRIEPEEIERALLAHPLVRGAFVAADGEGEARRLVAAVATDKATEGELHAWLSQKLPSFMRPAQIVTLGDLPTTSRGKVDSQAVMALVGTSVPNRPPHRAPRDPLEAELVAIWQEILGVSAIGIDDDFFALGGQSLSAAQMLERIESRLGRRIALSRLLNTSTIAQLASVLFEDAPRQPVVALRERGSRPPLFFFHGDVNGGGFYCRRLADGLSPEQPIYVLGDDQRCGPGGLSVEALAERYRGLVDATCPSGPIAVGGYCHGALLAFELARRLRDTRPITNVLLVHPPAVEPRLLLVANLVRAWQRLRSQDERWRVETMVRIVLGLEFARDASMAQRATWLRQKIARGSRRQAAADLATMARAQSPGRHDPDTWDQVVRAVIAYVPGRYEGPLTIITGEEASTAEAWRRAAPSARVAITAGTHATCVTSELPSLALVLEAALRSADCERLARLG